MTTRRRLCPQRNLRPRGIFAHGISIHCVRINVASLPCHKPFRTGSPHGLLLLFFSSSSFSSHHISLLSVHANRFCAVEAAILYSEMLAESKIFFKICSLLPLQTLCGQAGFILRHDCRAHLLFLHAAESLFQLSNPCPQVVH